MKTKNIFLISIFTLFVVLLNGSVFAYALKCDEINIYCNYQGLYQNINNADEEFDMLLEPTRHANFKEMFEALYYIVGCSEENQECMEALKNSGCNISRYAQKLLEFYKVNEKEIENEEVIKLLDILKNGYKDV